MTLSTFTLLHNHYHYISLELFHHPKVKKKEIQPWREATDSVQCLTHTWCTGPRTSSTLGKGGANLFSFHTAVEKLLEWYNPLSVSLDPKLPWLLLLHFKRCIHTLNKRWKAVFIGPSYWANSVLLSLYSSYTFYLIYWCLMFSSLANVVFPAVHGN